MWQRWNQTTHIFEKSDNDGASWTPLGLDAAILTEGTINVARLPSITKALLPSAVAYEDEANSFNQNQTIGKVRPSLVLDSGPTNKARIHSRVSNVLNLTHNLSYDGAAWNLDDTTQGGTNIELQTGSMFFQFATPGANPRALVTPLTVSTGGLQVSVNGGIATLGNAGTDGAYLGLSGTLPIIDIDDTNAGAGNRRYRLIADTSTIALQMLNDDFSVNATLWSMGRAAKDFTVPGRFTTKRGVVTAATGVFDGVLDLEATTGLWLIHVFCLTADPGNYSGIYCVKVNAGVASAPISFSGGALLNCAMVGTIFRVQQNSGTTLTIEARGIRI